MSVFIKGFDKPKNCFGCDFNSYDCFCKLSHGGIDRDDWTCDKPCPIIEVPAPHGRLIDADALKNYIENDGHTEAFAMAQIGREGKFFLMGNIIADIDEQPTVIEAEGRTDEAD